MVPVTQTGLVINRQQWLVFLNFLSYRLLNHEKAVGVDPLFPVQKSGTGAWSQTQTWKLKCSSSIRKEKQTILKHCFVRSLLWHHCSPFLSYTKADKEKQHGHRMSFQRGCRHCRSLSRVTPTLQTWFKALCVSLRVRFRFNCCFNDSCLILFWTVQTKRS